MCQSNILNVVEKQLLSNAVNTVYYLLDALNEHDFQSAILEVEELNFVIRRLVDIKKKREKQKVLEELIKELKEKGVNIDFAKKATFLRISAKNAVKNNQNFANTHKKRQQA